MEKQTLNISCRCSEVTLDEFIDCLINSNLRRLVRSGNPTDEELQAAWAALYSEYSELTGNKEYQYYFSVYRSVYAMRLKMRLAQLLLNDHANVNFNDLQELGYKGDVDKIIARLQFETVELLSKEKELENMKKKEGGTVKESDFDDWVISVGKYLGYGIKRKEMLLSEFLSAHRAMQREYEAKRKSGK